MIPDPTTTPTLGIDAAAEFLGISRNHAYEAAKRGEIPSIRIGRRIRVPTAALLRMIDVEPTPAAEVEPTPAA